MEKDFKKWMEQKAKIHNDKIRPFFHEREVWFSSLGENVGFEQDGNGEGFMCPVLILKKFNNEVVWVLPLTRTDKTGKYYFRISLIANDGKIDDNPSVVILSQLRLIDVKRLQYKIGTATKDEFTKIKEALVALLK
jgi:mRNA-degrading endonuclease toxin of MazEF toxin-antitoxin module